MANRTLQQWCSTGRRTHLACSAGDQNQIRAHEDACTISLSPRTGRLRLLSSQHAKYTDHHGHYGKEGKHTRRGCSSSMDMMNSRLSAQRNSDWPSKYARRWRSVHAPKPAVLREAFQHTQLCRGKYFSTNSCVIVRATIGPFH
jgi:hypothetical protein